MLRLHREHPSAWRPTYFTDPLNLLALTPIRALIEWEKVLRTQLNHIDRQNMIHESLGDSSLEKLYALQTSNVAVADNDGNCGLRGHRN